MIVYNFANCIIFNTCTMSYFMLIYHLSDNYLERRPAYREEHLSLAKEFADLEYLMLGGALDSPADISFLIFKTEKAEIPQHFVDSDPYVREGLVLSYEIRKWNVAAGYAI